MLDAAVQEPPTKTITGAQMRAARSLLRWSQMKLAEVSGVSPKTIRRIEEFDGCAAIRSTRKRSLAKIRDVLEEAGVEFGKGSGVRKAE